MLNIITAHLGEASPFICSYGLSSRVAKCGLKYYANDHIRLLVSGQGSENCLISINRFNQAIGVCPQDLWLNFGVAGSSQFAISEMVQGKQIDAPGMDTIKLCSILDLGVPWSRICSAQRIETEYADQGVFDMEAATIAVALGKFGRLEQLTVVKLISDGPSRGVPELRPALLKQLIGDATKNVIEACDIILAGSINAEKES